MPHDPLPPAAPAGGLANLIRALARRSRAGDPVTLGDAIDGAGARVHGAAILLLAFPEALPLPIPSFGAVLGVPLLAVSLHMAVYGEDGDLPARARRVALPPRMVALMDRYLAPWLTRAERVGRDRLPRLATQARAVGLVCALMAGLLFLPVPLMNVPPALALVCLSWGMVQRDGLIVALGLAMSVGICVSILALAARFGAWIGGAGI